MNLSQQIEARRAAMGNTCRKEFAVTKADIANEDEHIILVKFANFGNKDSAGDILIKDASPSPLTTGARDRPQTAKSRSYGNMISPTLSAGYCLSKSAKTVHMQKLS